MHQLIFALAILVASGVAALLVQRSARWATQVAAAGAVAACLLGLGPVLEALSGGRSLVLQRAWAVPYGSFTIELDALSAFFLLPVLGLSALAAIYGTEYLRGYADKKSLGPPCFFFNLLVASMVLVVTARNAVLFLVAWEVMSLASYFLVTFEDEEESVRRAGWTYLVATHLGTAFLLAMFIVLGRDAGSFDFDQLAAAGRLTPGMAGVLFGLAVVGFGTKAGFMPLHVWLPEAHPAAPSHVSAVMSGVMIKTGIYGLVRTLILLGPPPAWWGWVLIGIGVSSGVLGVLFALAQHDLKRLLAYHSVENIGIIVLGLGVGVLGLSAGSPMLAVLGFAGGLLHVLNHALFKGLLFLGSGSVLHATHTREIDHLGGLLKKMPWTGTTFLVGTVAISGLPPLNGFVSEFLIYVAAYQGVASGTISTALAVIAVLAGLRHWLLAGREVAETVTWDCGYTQPTRRMQYTASSFAQPLVDLFAPLLSTRRRVNALHGIFPGEASFATETPDRCREAVYRPAFRGIGSVLNKLRWLQHGRVQAYVLYIVIVLLALLVWKLG